jgi:TFIIF-interacting CTD phosphatase-like protein
MYTMKAPRLQLFLDLDETLIHAVTVEEFARGKKQFKKYRHHRMPDSDYWILERPGVQRFLDVVAASFELSVWTAASQSYAAFIMQKVLQADSSTSPGGTTRRSLRFGFCSYHCELAREMCGSGTNKDLRFITKFAKDCTRDRMVILDDHPNVFSTQPHNCIQIRPFKASGVDNELLHVILPVLLHLQSTREITPGTRLGAPYARAASRVLLEEEEA